MFRIPFRSRVSDLDLKHFESDLASTGFQGSLIALFPRTNTSWLSLGLLKFVSVPGCRRPPACRFLPSRRKPILFSPLAVSTFGFGVIAFAKNMRAQFSTVAELFGYFVGIAIVMILVLLIPPFRSTWLSNLIAR